MDNKSLKTSLAFLEVNTGQLHKDPCIFLYSLITGI